MFEVGISNLVCGCILGWQNVSYHNTITVTLNLTSDIVSRNCIESGAYLLYSLRLEFQNRCVNAFWHDRVSKYFRVTVTLTFDLVLSNNVSASYHLYYLRYIFQILFVDASLDGGMSGTIFESLWPWPLT